MSLRHPVHDPVIFRTAAFDQYIATLPQLNTSRPLVQIFSASKNAAVFDSFVFTCEYL